MADVDGAALSYKMMPLLLMAGRPDLALLLLKQQTGSPTGEGEEAAEAEAVLAVRLANGLLGEAALEIKHQQAGARGMVVQLFERMPSAQHALIRLPFDAHEEKVCARAVVKHLGARPLGAHRPTLRRAGGAGLAIPACATHGGALLAHARTHARGAAGLPHAPAAPSHRRPASRAARHPLERGAAAATRAAGSHSRPARLCAQHGCCQPAADHAPQRRARPRSRDTSGSGWRPALWRCRVWQTQRRCCWEHAPPPARQGACCGRAPEALSAS